MQHRFIPVAIAIGLSTSLGAGAQPTSTDTSQEQAPVKSLGIVTVFGSRPSSLPTQIPTTIEGITRTQMEQTINATDSEDVLKYFPSLVVRRRYIGDYNHAVLSSQASAFSCSRRYRRPMLWLPPWHATTKSPLAPAPQQTTRPTRASTRTCPRLRPRHQDAHFSRRPRPAPASPCNHGRAA